MRARQHLQDGRGRRAAPRLCGRVVPPGLIGSQVAREQPQRGGRRLVVLRGPCHASRPCMGAWADAARTATHASASCGTCTERLSCPCRLCKGRRRDQGGCALHEAVHRTRQHAGCQRMSVALCAEDTGGHDPITTRVPLRVDESLQRAPAPGRPEPASLCDLNRVAADLCDALWRCMLRRTGHRQDPASAPASGRPGRPARASGPPRSPRCTRPARRAPRPAGRARRAARRAPRRPRRRQRSRAAATRARAARPAPAPPCATAASSAGCAGRAAWRSPAAAHAGEPGQAPAAWPHSILARPLLVGPQARPQPRARQRSQSRACRTTPDLERAAPRRSCLLPGSGLLLGLG